MFQILVPAEFREQHRRIVLEFLQRGHEFSRQERRQSVTAFDLLKNAAVLTDSGLHDLIVLGFKGDIKTSVYFLQAARTRALPHDFYITRIRGRQRTRTLVVFMRSDMWQAIDGETLLVLLEEVADTLPQAARIIHEGIELTIIDYEAWKAKVKQRQSQATDRENGGNNGSTDN